MENLSINLKISPELYTKDPNSSTLGRNIVSKGIIMINDLGFESFTFKKLGQEIGSNESSIYRYFESKHMLLLYLLSWYWSWVEYNLVFSTTNIKSPKIKLEEAILLLTNDVTVDNSFSYIDETILHKIIVAESSKGYHTKEVDIENEKGYFKTYKRVVQRVSDIVLENNPTYHFPHMLVSTIIEGAHKQHYFAEHIPSLTDTQHGKNTIVKFYTNLVFKVI